MGSSGAVGNIGLTAVLAGLAVVLSAVTYIANKRRSNETHPSGPLGTHSGTTTTNNNNNNNSNNKNNNNNNAGAKRSGGGIAGTGVGPKSYYAVRAERHVRPHSGTAVEWRDDVLGVRMLFSPILFAVETEERQAPLVLVGLRYLRQPEHRVAVTIEECTFPPIPPVAPLAGVTVSMAMAMSNSNNNNNNNNNTAATTNTTFTTPAKAANNNNNNNTATATSTSAIPAAVVTAANNINTSATINTTMGATNSTTIGANTTSTGAAAGAGANTNSTSGSIIMPTGTTADTTATTITTTSTTPITGNIANTTTPAMMNNTVPITTSTATSGITTATTMNTNTSTVNSSGSNATMATAAEEYRENSLARIRDCAKILSCGTTRIGSTSHPCAEYCYMDSNNRLRYALSVFLTHGRLAITAQYIADTRVKGVLPTAFNELVRSIQFYTPRPTPSYLLCAEPRLGLGFRLPLDFVLDEQLRETITAAAFDTILTPVHGEEDNNNNNNNNYYGGTNYFHNNPYTTSHGANTNSNSNSNSGGGGESVPFATLIGRGLRRMVVIASYELFPRGHLSWRPLFEHHLRTTLERFSVIPPALQTGITREGRGEFPITILWSEETSPREVYDKRSTFIVRPQQLFVPLRGDSAVDDGAAGAGGVGSGSNNVLMLDGAFCVQEVSLDPDSVWAMYLRDIEPQTQPSQQGYRDEVEDSGIIINNNNNNKSGLFTGNKNNPNTYNHHSKSHVDHTNNNHMSKGDSNNNNNYNSSSNNSASCRESGRSVVTAYMSFFCLRVRDAYVSFGFLSSTTRHTLEEFITFCRRTLDTVSVGNHYGQGTSLIYCNTRHEVMPFEILLDPVCMESIPASLTGTIGTATAVVVEETTVGDPLAVIHIGGIERITVLLRVFPCPGVSQLQQLQLQQQSQLQQLQLQQRKSIPATASLLERVVQNYLAQLPERVSIHYWETTTLGSRTVLEIHYEQLIDEYENDNDNDNNSDADSLTLDEEVGHMNPFSRYCALCCCSSACCGCGDTPLPPLFPQPSQLSSVLPITMLSSSFAAAAAAVPTKTTNTTNSTSPSTNSLRLRRRSPSCDSREDVATIRVAVVVCFGGCAFLFLSSSTLERLSVVRHTVRQLAANLSVMAETTM